MNTFPEILLRREASSKDGVLLNTYLLWLDFSDLKLTEKEKQDLIVNKAKLWLDPGFIFGEGGEGFERINIACPRALLTKALKQLNQAITEYTK